ncbi:FecR family protein [Desertivirga brevis]|uniref:FecR family protein n=1 Tax=Desertivirga brevis TaxID=2810310 RepID=UPI001A97B7B5|nr:FecR domain-containing protein [Pedobacter sp. SYSU D00873]
MQSQKYTLDELIVDPDFISWVKNQKEVDGRKWLEWSLTNPENSRILAEARELVLELSLDADEPEQQELADLWNRIEASNQIWDQKQGNNHFCIRSIVTSWYKVAAVAAGLLMLGVFAKIYLIQSTSEQKTAFGEQRTVILPDSSVVVLNANSTIEYAEGWQQDKPREVFLDGEAFFSVTHKKNSQKFVVHTKDLDVQVLGTKFDVNTRRSQTRVFLKSGKVKLYLTQIDNKEVDMKPGDMVRYTTSQKAIIRKKVVKPQIYTAWLEKKLVFEDTPLLEIAHLLEDNYGYKVQFNHQELESLTFTGSIESNDVDLLLTILQKTFNISIIKKEGNLFIGKK